MSKMCQPMRQRPKGEEHEGDESVGDLSQVITSDFIKSREKEGKFEARALSYFIL